MLNAVWFSSISRSILLTRLRSTAFSQTYAFLPPFTIGKTSEVSTWDTRANKYVSILMCVCVCALYCVAEKCLKGIN